jgi:hypothetical protein
VEFCSLPVFAFSIGRSVSGAKKLFVAPAVGFGKLEVAFSVSWCSTRLQSFCLSFGVRFVLLAKDLPVSIPRSLVEGRPSFPFILLHTCEVSP